MNCDICGNPHTILLLPHCFGCERWLSFLRDRARATGGRLGTPVAQMVWSVEFGYPIWAGRMH